MTLEDIESKRLVCDLIEETITVEFSVLGESHQVVYRKDRDELAWSLTNTLRSVVREATGTLLGRLNGGC